MRTDALLAMSDASADRGKLAISQRRNWAAAWHLRMLKTSRRNALLMKRPLAFWKGPPTYNRTGGLAM
jgi:hypothetical protein